MSSSCCAAFAFSADEVVTEVWTRRLEMEVLPAWGIGEAERSMSSTCKNPSVDGICPNGEFDAPRVVLCEGSNACIGPNPREVGPCAVAEFWLLAGPTCMGKTEGIMTLSPS